MIPVPAAAVKNINNAAANEIGMTDQELEKALVEVKAEIAKFGPDKELSNHDWRRKMQLVEQYQVLEKIQKARALPDLSRASKLMTYYHLLIQEKNMNPLLMYLLKLKLKSTIWI
jgi:hypothetical protein